MRVVATAIEREGAQYVVLRLVRSHAPDEQPLAPPLLRGERVEGSAIHLAVEGLHVDEHGSDRGRLVAHPVELSLVERRVRDAEHRTLAEPLDLRSSLLELARDARLPGLEESSRRDVVVVDEQRAIPIGEHVGDRRAGRALVERPGIGAAGQRLDGAHEMTQASGRGRGVDVRVEAHRPQQSLCDQGVVADRVAAERTSGRPDAQRVRRGARRAQRRRATTA